MALIELSNVTKSYGASSEQAAVEVLKSVSLDIGQGEFVALMGASGSGKTTLLTVLGAMNAPTTGRVSIDGINVYKLGEERLADFRREYLGFVFQQHCLMPYLTAVENVMLPLATKRKSSSAAKRAKALEMLRRVGLEDKAGRLPNQLSGGEQGRVAIARAIVNDPPLLLADEPTGTLDSRTGEEIMRMFEEFNDSGQTIFMVTHNEQNAKRATRVLNICDGVLDACGTPVAS